MSLQYGSGAVDGHGTLHHALYGVCLVLACGDHYYLPCSHDARKAHRCGLGGHLGDVSVEESGVVAPGLLGKIHEVCKGIERAARLVEGDVSVASYAQHLDVYDVPGELVLVGPAVRLGILAAAQRNVDVLIRDVDVVEEVLVHEGPVALPVVSGKTDVLVEIECKDVLVAGAVLLVVLYHLLIKPDGGGACSKAQHRGVVSVKDALHYLEGFLRYLVVGILDGYMKHLLPPVTIFVTLFGANILRRCKWKTSALATPVIFLIFGSIFFALTLYNKYVKGATILGVSALTLAVWFGVIQNALVKSVKYSLFDSTKNMAYLPLDPDTKTKGQAAVEVVGGRAGKAGAAFIQQIMFAFVAGVMNHAISIIGIYVVTVLIWISSVCGLSPKYEKALADKEKAAA